MLGMIDCSLAGHQACSRAAWAGDICSMLVPIGYIHSLLIRQDMLSQHVTSRGFMPQL